MVWNVAKDGIRTRMAVPNHESYPAPPQRAKEAAKAQKGYRMTDFSFSGVEPESAKVTNELIEAFNKKLGTNIQPAVTKLP